MLYQAADLDPALTAARGQPQVIKAILMAGADKSKFPAWDRTPTRPLDDRFGAGELNVYNSYHILKAGQQAASSIAAVANTGWDYTSVAAGAPQYYYFDITGNSTDRLSALLSWNRIITDSNPDPDTWTPSAYVPNLNLRLYSATGFALGAQVDSSVSALDNVQCIYQTTLPAGRYALEVTAASGSANYALAWQSTITTYAAGDFNHDGYVSADDIDLLYRNFGANSFYDLNGDGVVNQADVTQLVETILGTGFGDANLDRNVNFTDFQALLDHWTGTGGWASGDFSGDGRVNFPDFQMLLDNWNPVGLSPPAGPLVPEPGTCALLLGGAVLVVLRYRNRRG
jgi:hypothetical protein